MLSVLSTFPVISHECILHLTWRHIFQCAMRSLSIVEFNIRSDHSLELCFRQEVFTMGGADAQSFFHICLKASLSVWGFGNGLKKHRKAKIQIAQNLESIGPQGFPGCIFFSNKTHYLLEKPPHLAVFLRLIINFICI